MQKASARGLFCDTRNYHRSKNDILRLVLYDAGDGIFLFTGFICGAFVQYCRGIPVYSFTRAVNTDTGIFVSHARSGARFGSGLLMNIAEQLASTGLFLTNTGSGAADIAAGALSVSLLALLITNERFENIVRASFYISLAFLICSILPGALT